mmetsp:Transcript_62544/g.182868  ORF Transcript_62544/g.182868 Transcript_62544/m.182868 type:complete len:231 (-) Transcript_62544:1020-1712(-)
MPPSCGQLPSSAACEPAAALNSKRPAWSLPAEAVQARFAASTASASRWPAFRRPRRPPAPANEAAGREDATAGCCAPTSPTTSGSASIRTRISSKKRRRSNSRNESPYCGVRCTANSKHLRARPRWKCGPNGFMKTRAPSHQTSPLFGTSRTALRNVAMAASAPPSPLCSSAMRADQRRPVAGWSSRAWSAASLAACIQPWRASMKMCSRKIFQSCPSHACASLSASRAA